LSSAGTSLFIRAAACIKNTWHCLSSTAVTRRVITAAVVVVAAQGNSRLQEPENLEVLSKALDKIYAKQVSSMQILIFGSQLAK
jgi:hypothetical protein